MMKIRYFQIYKGYYLYVISGAFVAYKKVEEEFIKVAHANTKKDLKYKLDNLQAVWTNI